MRAFYRKFNEYLERVFAIDIRALAVLRVGVALLVIADLCRRAKDLTAHYTDAGIWPTEAAITHVVPTVLPSIHLLNGSFIFQAVLFALAGISAFLMLVGYRTTIFTFTTWFLTLSLQLSSTPYQQGGDWELLLLLFWGMFLPLGATFSIDRAGEQCLAKAGRVFSLASVGFTLQILYIYFFAFFHKSGEAWKVDFNAVEHALKIDQYATQLGIWLGQFDWVTVTLTISVLAIQLLALPVILAPWKSVWPRNLMVFLLICTHIGYFFFLHIGLFALISTVGLLVLFTSSVYDRLSCWLFSGEPIAIYYDFECGFCRKSVWLIKTLFLVPTSHIGPAQEVPEVWKTMQERDSWVVTDIKGNQYTTFQAGVRIAQSSGWLFWLAYLARPQFIQRFGEWFYRLVAHNRRHVTLPGPRAQDTQLKSTSELLLVIKNAFLLWAILTITLVNVNAFTEQDILPEAWKWQVHLLRLEQPWHVFAPTPRREDGWFVFVATTTSGQVVDAYTTEAVIYEKPSVLANTFPNQRWRKLITNFPYEWHAYTRPYFMDWLCREWGTQYPDDEMAEISMIFMLEFTERDGSEREPVPVYLSRYNCATMMELPLPSNAYTNLAEGVAAQKRIDHEEEDEGAERE